MKERDRNRVWELLPGLFRWSEVAEFAEADRAEQEIRASKERTDASGQDLYRVYVLTEARRGRSASSPRGPT